MGRDSLSSGTGVECNLETLLHRRVRRRLVEPETEVVVPRGHSLSVVISSRKFRLKVRTLGRRDDPGTTVSIL